MSSSIILPRDHMVPPIAFRTAQRLLGMEVSEILQITFRAAELRRAGHPIIALGAGEPDFPTPEHVVEAAARAMRSGDTRYTPVDGTLALKEAIVAKFATENGLDFIPEEVIASTGGKQILFNAFMASLDPGDEVIVPAPYWTSYLDIVSICGGVPVAVPCGEENRFCLTPEALEAAITPRTRWLLLNAPSNPSGAAYRAEDLRALATVLERHPHVWVLSDDMYEHILYDDAVFATMAQAAPALRARTLTMNGVSNQGLCHDRLAHRLRCRAACPDPGHGGRAESIDELPQLCEPSRSRGGANRRPGAAGRAPGCLPAATRPDCAGAERHSRAALPEAGWRLLHLRELRRCAWRHQARWHADQHGPGLLCLSVRQRQRRRRARQLLRAAAIFPDILRRLGRNAPRGLRPDRRRARAAPALMRTTHGGY
jgi:hypothetical protein